MFDSVILYEGTPIPTLSHKFPTAELDEREFIDPLSIPKQISTGALQSTIFCFNTPTYFCFSWSFRYTDHPFSIVIVTKSFYASLFYEFLQAVASCFPPNSPDSDPLCRYGFVKSLLISWQSNGATTFLVNYPLTSFTLDLTSITSWLTKFSVASIFTSLEQIWHALLSNEGVLIIGATPELASTAAIAALSLLGDVRYTDPMLLFTQEGDPRIENIDDYKLVATTDDRFPRLNFKIVVIARVGVRELQSDLQRSYAHRTSRYYSMMLNLLNFKLLGNPYFDLLELPLDLREFALSRDLDLELLGRLQFTKTFGKWRKQRTTRDNARTAFLSVIPREAVKCLKPADFEKALDYLVFIGNIYERDKHLHAVLKYHAGLIRRMEERRRRRRRREEEEEEGK
jgi:hypothetical protein